MKTLAIVAVALGLSACAELHGVQEYTADVMIAADLMCANNGGVHGYGMRPQGVGSVPVVTCGDGGVRRLPCGETGCNGR